MKCALDEDINTCQFFIRKNKECMNEKTCSFQEKEKKNTGKYVRQERWYEKYWRK